MLSAQFSWNGKKLNFIKMKHNKLRQQRYIWDQHISYAKNERIALPDQLVHLV